MTIKIIAAISVILSCLQLGCVSNTGQKSELPTLGPVIPKYIDIKAKQEYVQNVKASLKLYNHVILDIKYYHGKHNKIYVKDILLDSELNGSMDTRVEIAKIHLFVISMYLDIGYYDRVGEYLELFHDLYDSDKYLLDMTLNSGDVDYPSLGTGMRLLEERALRERHLFPHGLMYPRRKIQNNSNQK
jgi:hypothetical protein